MKIYVCRYHDADAGMLLSWHSSRADAEKALRSLQRERGEAAGVEKVDVVEIVPTRDGIISWLNRNFTTDNG